jgi:hypothetical protein
MTLTRRDRRVAFAAGAGGGLVALVLIALAVVMLPGFWRPLAGQVAFLPAAALVVYGPGWYLRRFAVRRP